MRWGRPGFQGRLFEVLKFRTMTDAIDRDELDVWYVENQSLWLEVKIL
jgi:lipopolysaccharide/colanic/teichoic acid biosynthesis glycosyltransferase